MTGIHQVTGYAESCKSPGIAGNDLNRCEVQALQRKELERRLKEQRHSLVDSRLWLGENLWCQLRKLAAFENSKTACSNKRCFGCEKGHFFDSCKAMQK